MKFRDNTLAAVTAGLLVCACSTPTAPIGDAHLLDVLQDGRATKEAVVLKLGQPSAVLESGRILTYRLGEQKESGYFIREAGATNWVALKYSLVLVFDKNEVLQRHSLVPVR